MQFRLILTLFVFCLLTSSCYKKMYFAVLADKNNLQKQNEQLAATNNSLSANNKVLAKSNDTLVHVVSNQNSQIDVLSKQYMKLKESSATLTEVLPTFHINGEDKDWSTQVILKIVYQGRDIANLECCSAGRPNRGDPCSVDHWCDGEDIPSNKHGLPAFKINEQITKGAIANAQYFIGMHSKDGSDRIKFNTALTLKYSDGTEQHWSWDDFDIKTKDDEGIKSYTKPLSQ